MEEFNELKGYLQDLKYPGIDIMQDEEIADIFGRKNKLFFISWFAQKWDPEIILPSEEERKDKVLSDFLYDNGFCTYEESIKFVHDDLELRVINQMSIIKKMLYNLRLLNSADQNTNKCDINYIEQMEIISKLDLNIFPMMGRLQIRKPEERLEKLVQYEQEIRELKMELERLNSTNYNDIEISDEKYNSDSIDLERDQISVLIANSIGVLKERTKRDKGSFDDSFENTIENCAEHISKIFKMYENRKSISEYSIAEVNAEDYVMNDTIADAIQNISILSQEILNMN